MHNATGRQTEAKLSSNARHASRAYVNSLEERLKLLESMLLRTTSPSTSQHSDSRQTSSLQGHTSSPPPQKDKTLSALEWSDDDQYDQLQASDHHSACPTPMRHPFDDNRSSVHRRSSLDRGLAFSSFTGFTNFSESVLQKTSHDDSPVHQVSASSPSYTSRSGKILQDIPLVTREHLLDVFWSQYNVVMRVVHREAFQQGKSSRNTQVYSEFLEICMLAMGARFYEPSEPGYSRATSQLTERALSSVANLVADYTLEASRGLPTAQGLLILADINIGNGNTSVGRYYLSVSCRLTSKLSLNDNDVRPSLTDLETHIRDMAFCACIYADRNWSLFLETPLLIDSECARLGIRHLADHHMKHEGNHHFLGFDTQFELHIYETRFPFAAIVGDIVAFQNTNPDCANPDAYLALTKLDQRLHAWHTSLSDYVKWTPVNILKAPLPLLLLHQQFHAMLILLHQPFAYPNLPQMDGTGNDAHLEAPQLDIPFSRLSRTACFNNGARIALIFKQYQDIFKTVQMVSTGIHPAGTAALALLVGKSTNTTVEDGIEVSRHLKYLIQALRAMAQMYPLAEKVLEIVNNIKDHEEVTKSASIYLGIHQLLAFDHDTT
ncbi:hypothetical protein V501_07523 [Pseudogymnoascus sp. VKM F-4519 (FW-2642)]|nr:hypothetical protein V501_07523 [Pseudogymnoascus sp. VKM F-4519 (FW-2642)]